MKSSIGVFFMILFGVLGMQELAAQTDSIYVPLDSNLHKRHNLLLKKRHLEDSLKYNLSFKQSLDSIPLDSLNGLLYVPQHIVKEKQDSINNWVANQKGKISGVKDSVQNVLHQPKYFLKENQEKLAKDFNNKIENTENELKEALEKGNETITNKANSKIEEVNASISNLTQGNVTGVAPMEDLNLDTGLSEVSESLKVQEGWLDINGVGDIGIDPKLSLDESLSNIDLSDLDLNPDLSLEGLEGIQALDGIEYFDGIGDKLSNYGENFVAVNDQISKVSKDIEKVVQDAGEAPELLEKEFLQLKEVQHFQEQTVLFENLEGDIEKQKEVFERYQNKEEVKNEVLKRLEAIAKLAAEQPKIQEALNIKDEAMQYASLVKAAKDTLSLKPSNALKGRNILERSMAGIQFQLYNQDPFRMDLNAYWGYYWNTNWLTGAGMVFRYQWEIDNSVPQLHQDHSIYGFRVFTEYMGLKVVNLHLEIERLHTGGYNVFTEYAYNQKWVNGLYLGIGKRFKISHNFKGNTMMLFNFLGDEKSPYPNKIQIRFGFDLAPLKNKKL